MSPVLDISTYKPVPATLGDANQVANGLQAIQNVVNALDQNNWAAGKIFAPSKLMQEAAIDGDPLCWDNALSKWVPASTLAAGRPRAPRVVVSTWAGGPPASPVDQDIWIATAVDAAGLRWEFQYNAGSGSAYKWEWIGGGDISKLGNANAVLNTMTQVAATNFWADAALQSYTVTRAGDWSIRGMFNIASNGGVQSPITAGVFGGGATIGAGGMGAVRMNNPLAVAVSTDSTATIEETVFAQGANAVIGIAGNSGVVGTHKMLYTSMRIRPARIS